MDKGHTSINEESAAATLTIFMSGDAMHGILFCCFFKNGSLGLPTFASQALFPLSLQ